MKTAIARVEPTAIAMEREVAFTDDQIQLIKDTIAQGATDDELKLFMAICTRRRLDPFAKQIYLVKRYDATLGREVAQPQVAVDGLRLCAQRTGLYLGQTKPEWCGEDGVWREAWFGKGPPAAARVGVLKLGNAEPTYAVAHYDEYVQTKRDGRPVNMWARMPRNQLLKCAESLALRKAFPDETSGLYTDAEMGQADSEAPVLRGSAAEAAEYIDGGAERMAELKAADDDEKAKSTEIERQWVDIDLASIAKQIDRDPDIGKHHFERWIAFNGYALINNMHRSRGTRTWRALDRLREKLVEAGAYPKDFGLNALKAVVREAEQQPSDVEPEESEER